MSSSDNTTPPLTVPPFESRLPEEFLKGLDERGKYLYIKLDEIGQTQTWLINQAKKDSVALGDLRSDMKAVKEQTTRTNGRLLVAEGTLTNIAPEIETVKTVKKVVGNRYAIMAMLAFMFIGVPWLGAHATVVISWFKAGFSLVGVG